MTYTSDEFVSFCTKTHQPDYYVVEIRLVGSSRGIESKSLKLYLASYNTPGGEGHFCEELSDLVAKDALPATEAEIVEVTLHQKSRGGVSIKSRATVQREKPVIVTPIQLDGEAIAKAVAQEDGEGPLPF